jgi:hypothetical protein
MQAYGGQGRDECCVILYASREGNGDGILLGDDTLTMTRLAPVAILNRPHLAVLLPLTDGARGGDGDQETYLPTPRGLRVC